MKIRDFRREAREALKGNWFVAVVAGVIMTLLSNVGVSIDMEAEDEFSSILSANLTLADSFPLVASVFVVVMLSLLLSSLLTVGYAQFNIDLIDGEKPRIITLFTKWRQIGKAIVASFRVFLRVVFGLILFIVPGIIAAYSHAMVYHILAENPDMSVSEAMAESRRIMRGNKFRLFCLQFSFFGWYLLVAITFGIAALWVIPYQQAAVAAFYREIS